MTKAVDDKVKEYMRSIGKKGGASGKGAKKDRRVTLNDPDFYKRLASQPRKRKSKDAKA